ncbi:hypothetical protein pb186bvf_010262 [Paramecium bursaria]
MQEQRSHKIIMTKNPTEIKSLRSSCLLTEGVCSPTERKPQKQAIQGQQFQNEVFDNIYLKQSYLPDKKKLHTQQYNTTIKSYKSPPKIKSQSLSNIKLECRLDCKLDSKIDSKLDSKIEVKKHKPLMKKIKQKITSTARVNKSPAKSKSKPNKPLNDIIKKFIKSKIPKSKSKSPEPKRLKNKKVINSSPKFQILPQSPTYLSPKYDDPSDRKQRTLSKKRPRFGSPQKLQQTLQTQRIQQLIQKPKAIKKQTKKRNIISQEHQSKHSSFRLNTISMQKSFLSEDPQKQIFEEIQQLDQFQLSQFQKFLQNLKNGKKDEAQQTSLHEPERPSLRENIQQQHQKLAMEPKPVPVEKIKRDSSLIWEEICLQRETGIKLRVNTQLQAFESLLQQQKISPRSFHQKKQIIQNWSQKQLDQLNSLKSNLQQIQTLSNSLLKRNQADLLFVNDLQNNSSLALNPLNESQSVDISVLKEESFIDQSDIQFSLPNSPKIPANSPISNLNMKKKDIVIEQAEPAVYHRQLQVSPTENQGKISEFEKIPDLNMITQARFTNLKFESVTMLTIQHLIDEAAEEIFQFCNIQPQPLIEQFNYPQGIQTNLGIINEVINKLCQFISEQKHDQFIGRMNYPYGKMPFQRLRSLHGYEDENEIPNNPLENYFQQFVEYLNLEDAPFQEFEITHNKAIFDAFNETLNIFRPFFMVNGLPYPWCYSERHLTVIIINNDNLQILFEKVKQKVLEYASSLCGRNDYFMLGLLSDEDHVNVKGNYQSALDQIQQQENDYVGFIREERLQKVLLQEITENEYLWHQSDDQKTEILMEVTDYLFEDLIEEMLHELKMIFQQ